MAIPSERIYLLPYYHLFLKSGTVELGVIKSPMDPEGEWLRKGVNYSSPGKTWAIQCVKNATRDTLISLLQRAQSSGGDNLGMVMVCLNKSEAVVEAAEKLGIAIYQFPEEPRLPPVPCSTCGKRLDPSKPPWRCADCATKFTGEHRMVICHRCLMPFRTSPSLDHKLADALKESGVWTNEIICPDCRIANLKEPLLHFDGTLKSVILWGLLRGHLRLEGLIRLGIPTEYVDGVIRPSFMRLSLEKVKRAGTAAKGPLMPQAIFGVDKSGGGTPTPRPAGTDSVVGIYTAVGGALGGADEVSRSVSTPIELEVLAVEEAFRTGTLRELDESTSSYLDRVRGINTPPAPIEPLTLINAIDSNLMEAYGSLREEDAGKLRKVEESIVARLRDMTKLPEEPDESLLGYLVRLRGSLAQQTIPSE